MNFVAKPSTLALVPVEERVRAIIDGVTIADSTDVIRVEEVGHRPVFYFPLGDVRQDLLSPTRHSTSCFWKGQASYYSLHLPSGRTIDNAVWRYADPKAGVGALAERVAFYAHFVDAFVLGDDR